MTKLLKKNSPLPVDSRCYTKDYFLYWGKYQDFFKSKGVRLEKKYQKVLEIAQVKPGMKVLDLGCGRGELLVHIARLGAFVEGVDYSKAAIEFAKKSKMTQPKKVREKIGLKQEDVKNLNLPKNYYDRILAIDLIEHLRPWEVDLLFSKIRPALKDFGQLVIHTFPNRWVVNYGFYLYKIWHYLARRKPPVEKNRDSRYDPVMHINEQTSHSLKKYLRKHRFLFRIWLEEGNFYLMLKSFGAQKSWLKKIIVKTLGLWPLKLLFFNEIYVIAWKKIPNQLIKTSNSKIKMKIIHLDFDDLKSPLGGGQARVTFEISRRLAKRHQVTIITSKYPGSRDETIDNVKYVRVGLNTFPWNFAAYILMAPALVKKYPHDILIESFIPPISTMLTPLFTKKPVVGMAHWFFAKQMSQKYKFPFVLWERFGIRFYQNFIVYNREWGQQIRKLVPRANILINNFPVDGPLITPKFVEKDYILFLGRIDIHHKGLDLLLRAYDRIAQQISTKLVIAGGGREENRLKRMIQRTKNPQKIDFIGRYDSHQRGELLRNCKLVVLTSRYEMAPLVVQEAMSYAKPLIIFDITGTREVVSRECAIYVKPYDTVAYSQAILNLLKNLKQRKKMGQMARKRFEGQINWDESVRRQEKFLLNIVRRSKQRD